MARLTARCEPPSFCRDAAVADHRLSSSFTAFCRGAAVWPAALHPVVRFGQRLATTPSAAASACRLHFAQSTQSAARPMVTPNPPHPLLKWRRQKDAGPAGQDADDRHEQRAERQGIPRQRQRPLSQMPLLRLSANLRPSAHGRRIAVVVAVGPGGGAAGQVRSNQLPRCAPPEPKLNITQLCHGCSARAGALTLSSG